MRSEVQSFHPAIQAILETYSSSMLLLTAPRIPFRVQAESLSSVPASTLFPDARNPEASVSGLWLLLGQWEASHKLSQEIKSAEGSYWHAIAHRMEPDSFNAGYWFRQVGKHPIFPALLVAANAILIDSSYPHWQLKADWDPIRFIEWCDEARQQPGGRPQQVAEAIQKAEWQLLFKWCCNPPL